MGVGPHCRQSPLGIDHCVNDNMSNITVKLVETEEDMEAAVSIRFRVFVDEQSVPAEIELDEYDAVATHAIALEDGQAIGTGRERTSRTAWPA